MPTIPISDETLMAYADGELDAAASEELEWHAERQPEIAKRVVAFLRSRRLARAALPVEADEMAPDFLDRAMMGPPGEGANVVTLRPGRRSLLFAGAALAACGIGVVTGAGLFGEAHFGSPAAALETRASQQALARLATGEEAVSGRARLRAIATFALSDGQICREVAVTIADQSGDAVVCRKAGVWSTRIAVIAPASSDYQTAGKDDDPVDLYLRQIEAGEALSAQEERAALAAS